MINNRKNNQAEIHSGITVSIVFSLIALTLSIIALVNIFPRTEMDFDYLGLIIGILGFITAILIGWQIALTFISREQIREMDDKIKYTLNHNLYQVYIIQGRNEEDRSRFESALNYYFRSMESAQNGEMVHEVRKIVNKVKDILQNNCGEINKDDSEYYLQIVMSIDHEDQKEVMNLIKNKASENAPSQRNSWGGAFITSNQP